MNRPKWKNLAQFLFDELSCIDNCYEDDFMCIEDVRYYYDESVTENQYNKAKEYLLKIISNAKFYVVENRELFLQLHDNHTLWKINVPENYNGEYFEFEYCNIVESKLNEFFKKTKVEAGCYGRSGRHICIPVTMENLENYDKYQVLAEKLEQDVINHFDTLCKAA